MFSRHGSTRQQQACGISCSAEQILQFLQSIHVEPGHFRQQVVQSMAGILGWDRVDFWHADNKGNLFDPISSIGGRFLKEYLTGHYKNDYLHPLNLGVSRAVKHQTVYMQRLLTPEQFEKTDYFRFLAQHDIYHELAAYLKDGNGSLIGCIALARSKNAPYFSDDEIAALKIIAKHVSNALCIQSRLSELDCKKKILEAFCDGSEVGAVIFDLSFKVHYHNRRAREMCQELVDKDCRKLPIDSFLRTVMADKLLVWSSGFEKTIISPCLRRFQVTVTPAPYALFEKNKQIYLLCLDAIEPGKAKEPQNDHDDEGTLFNLTRREREVLELLIKGYTNHQIACELFVSIDTVKKHLRNIYDKMGVQNRTSAICKVISTVEKKA